MAFPQIASITATSINNDVSPKAIAMPATVNSGDLLLMFFSVNVNPTVTTPTGWTLIASENANDVSRLFAKKADGTEGGTTVNVAHSDVAATQSCIAHVVRITGWGGDATVANDVKASTLSTTSATPDFPALTPGWGALDTLWLAVLIGTDQDIAINNLPTGFDPPDLSSNPGFCGRIATGHQESASASLDPGVASMAASTNVLLYTVAVEPAAGQSNAPRALYHHRRRRT